MIELSGHQSFSHKEFKITFIFIIMSIFKHKRTLQQISLPDQYFKFMHIRPRIKVKVVIVLQYIYVPNPERRKKNSLRKFFKNSNYWIVSIGWNCLYLAILMWCYIINYYGAYSSKSCLLFLVWMAVELLYFLF